MEVLLNLIRSPSHCRLFPRSIFAGKTRSNPVFAARRAPVTAQTTLTDFHWHSLTLRWLCLQTCKPRFEQRKWLVLSNSATQQVRLPEVGAFDIRLMSFDLDKIFGMPERR